MANGVTSDSAPGLSLPILDSAINTAPEKMSTKNTKATVPRYHAIFLPALPTAIVAAIAGKRKISSISRMNT